MFSLIAFLAVLSILVIVHEFGHFIVAKRLGVRVEKFSLGFGPKVVSVKKGDTEYLISAIPLGGYVKMSGDEPWEKLVGERWEFLSRNVADRFKIIFAGPALNYIFAMILLSAVYMAGTPVTTTTIGLVLAGEPASKAGILAGDKVLAIDGKAINSGDVLIQAIHRRTKGSLALTMERDGKVFTVQVTPALKKQKVAFGGELSIGMIGIRPVQKIEKGGYGFFGSVYMGIKGILQITVVTYKALWDMVIGKLSFKESLTGPIGIFIMTGDMARLGMVYLLNLMAVLSASLAIFNVLPLPVLDGGHIIFLALEKLRGRPLSLKAQEIVTNIGITFLIMLTVFIFYSDIVKFGIFDKVVKIFRH